MGKMQLHVGTPADMGGRFAGAWNRAAAGEQVNETHVTFLDVQTMLDTLTPKEILQNLPICLVAVSHRWHPQHL